MNSYRYHFNFNRNLSGRTNLSSFRTLCLLRLPTSDWKRWWGRTSSITVASLLKEPRLVGKLTMRLVIPHTNFVHLWYFVYVYLLFKFYLNFIFIYKGSLDLWQDKKQTKTCVKILRIRVWSYTMAQSRAVTEKARNLEWYSSHGKTILEYGLQHWLHSAGCFFFQNQVQNWRNITFIYWLKNNLPR